MSQDIEKLGIRELANAYRDGSLSPVTVTRRLLEVIEEKKKCNAFVTVTAYMALAAAEASEARFRAGEPRSVMDGVPYALKDVMNTKGVLTTMCSRVYEHNIPGNDCAAASALSDAGGVPMGKLNAHEFAACPRCDLSLFGPVLNPLDLTRIAGGSSGGSGAALASFMLPATVGTDCAGSIRIPSSACGVVGLRPTFGLVSTKGTYAHSPTIDVVGPMTRTVWDNALLLGILAGGRDYTSELEKPVRGLTVGLPRAMYADSSEPVVRDAVDGAAKLLSDMGADVREVSHPDPDGVYTRSFALLRRCDIYYSNRKDILRSAELYFPENLSHMTAGERYAAWEYIEAQNMRAEFIARVDEAMRGQDVWIFPTLPMLPPALGAKEIEFLGRPRDVAELLCFYNTFAAALGYPALSLPCATTKEGLSIGLQIMGRPGADALVYRVGRQLERRLSEMSSQQSL